jgi:RNA polymerase sigma-70 factor, ECF subfamily
MGTERNVVPGSNGRPEVNLLRAAADGDRGALKALVVSAGGFLWLLCLRAVAGRVEDAEDLVQETLLRAIRGVCTFEPGRPVRPWLAAIAGSVIADHHRSEVVRRRDAAAAAQRCPGSGCGSSDRLDALQQALAEIDQVTRMSLHLRYAEKMSWERIGAVLGLTREAVKKRLQRGRNDLRRRLATLSV